MKPEEARVVAHICGDGWLTKYDEKNSLQIVNGRKYRRTRKRYQIGYCNKEKTLRKQFSRDITKVYCIKTRSIRIEVRCRSKRIFDRLQKLGGGNSKSWFVGKEIIKSNKKIKKEWLKSFFDDESTSTFEHGRIRIKSMNERGLKQVKKLLNYFKIK